jgi:hypothetical protein
MSKETTYAEALEYINNLPTTIEGRPLRRAWGDLVYEFTELPDGVRQALINRLIGLQKEQRHKADEKRAEWREKYGEDE